jgi:hypothetical protein
MMAYLCPTLTHESAMNPEPTPLIHRPSKPTPLVVALNAKDNQMALFYGFGSMAWVFQSVAIEVVFGTSIAWVVVILQSFLLAVVLVWRACLRARLRRGGSDCGRVLNSSYLIYYDL